MYRCVCYWFCESYEMLVQFIWNNKHPSGIQGVIVKHRGRLLWGSAWVLDTCEVVGQKLLKQVTWILIRFAFFFFPRVREMCGPRIRGWSLTLALDTELWNLLLKMQNLEDAHPSHNPVKKLLLARSHSWIRPKFACLNKFFLSRPRDFTGCQTSVKGIP